MKLSQTSEVESISREKACSPYWNLSVQEKSKLLWLPTETVLRDSGSNLSSGLQTRTIQNSWFSTKLHSPQQKSLPKTFCPSFTSSPVEPTAFGGTLWLSRKIRIYPTPTQVNLLKRWIGTYRKSYNTTVHSLNEKLGFSKPEVLRQLPDWSKETPYAIRGDAVREAQKALVSGIKKYKRTGEIFNLRFKSKKEPKQSIPIQIQNVRKSSLYPTLLGSLKTAEPIKGEAGGRIVWENGRWFYTEPRSVSILQSDNQRLESVSIDPGVRTFATLFSPELAGKVGAGASSRIYRLCLHLDALYSKISVSKGKRKYSLKKAAERLRWKIKDIITELHTKLGVWLCKTFKVIFLPTFGVQQMTSRNYQEDFYKVCKADAGTGSL